MCKSYSTCSQAGTYPLGIVSRCKFPSSAISYQLCWHVTLQAYKPYQFLVVMNVIREKNCFYDSKTDAIHSTSNNLSKSRDNQEAHVNKFKCHRNALSIQQLNTKKWKELAVWSDEMKAAFRVCLEQSGSFRDINLGKDLSAATSLIFLKYRVCIFFFKQLRLQHKSLLRA